MLERRYRRLLAWYPRAYRREYEEEILGVLLAGAGDRRRPGLGDSLDLIAGGLRIRARHAVRTFPESRVAEALAVAGLLVPVLLLAGAAPGLHEIAWWLRQDRIGGDFLLTFPGAPAWALWLVAAVLGLLGRRRAAVVATLLAAAGLTLELVAYPVNSLYFGAEVTPWVLLCLLGAVAAVASPGPRRGLAWLGVARYAAVLLASGLVVVTQLWAYHRLSALWLLPIVVLLACRPTTPTGRWVVALLAVPGTAYLILLQDAGIGWAAGYGISAAVVAALGGLLWTVTRVSAARD